MKKPLYLGLASVYLAFASIFAYQTVCHTNVVVDDASEMLDIDNYKNIVAVKEPTLFEKILNSHRIIGPLVVPQIKSYINQTFDIPSLSAAKQELDKISWLTDEAKREKTDSNYWSWFLLATSFIYLGSVMVITKKLLSVQVIFSLTIISLALFAVGISAPAMIMLALIPKNQYLPPIVLYHATRSILGVISELFSSKYWVVALCLTLFSVVIPVVKAGLTIFAIAFSFPSAKQKIKKLLHLIGKWSMADVFVAAILLAHYAVQANETMQARLFRGFYYFLGYCLISMVATTLLELRDWNIDEGLV